MAFTKNEKDYLLKLARGSIEHYFKTGNRMDIKPQDVPTKQLTEDGACFVTMYIGKALRGCIGSLQARRPLVFDVLDNALHSAFGDPRFYPLKEEELSNVKFTISILTKPVPLEVKDAKDLLKKLKPKKHGLIIQKGSRSATYLPAVWEQLPKKEGFLSELCEKAGLPEDAWRDTTEMIFQVYEAVEFGES